MNCCVQCHRELSGIYGKSQKGTAEPLTMQSDKIKDDKFGICGFSDCPNFSLVALGTEQLDKMEWLKKPPYEGTKECICRYNNFVSGGTAYGTPHEEITQEEYDKI